MGMLIANPVYDSHGNITYLGSGANEELYLYYDSSDRNHGFEQYDLHGNGASAYYARDVAGRITYRENYTITDWDWTLEGEQWYGFTNSSDAPGFVRNDNWDVVEKYLSLPGGVLLTIRPQQSGNDGKTYSLSNLNGHTIATTNATGTLLTTHTYDPYGNPTTSTIPNNTSPGSTYAWAGQHQKTTETSLSLTPIQMGARLYLPTLGRFTQLDPIPGGNANDYIYPTDPINMSDYTGTSAVVATWTFTGTFTLQGSSPKLQGSSPSLQSTINGTRLHRTQQTTVAIRVGNTLVRDARVTPDPHSLPNC